MCAECGFALRIPKGAHDGLSTGPPRCFQSTSGLTTTPSPRFKYAGRLSHGKRSIMYHMYVHTITEGIQTRLKRLFSPWGTECGVPLHAPPTYNFGEDMHAAIRAQDRSQGAGRPATPSGGRSSPGVPGRAESPVVADSHINHSPATSTPSPIAPEPASAQPRCALRGDSRPARRNRGVSSSESEAATTPRPAPYPPVTPRPSGVQGDGLTKAQFHHKLRNKFRRILKRRAQTDSAESIAAPHGAPIPDPSVLSSSQQQASEGVSQRASKRQLKQSAARHRKNAQPVRAVVESTANRRLESGLGLDYVPVVGKGFTAPVLSITEDDRRRWTAQELVDLLGFDYEEWDGR